MIKRKIGFYDFLIFLSFIACAIISLPFILIIAHHKESCKSFSLFFQEKTAEKAILSPQFRLIVSLS